MPMSRNFYAREVLLGLIVLTIARGVEPRWNC